MEVDRNMDIRPVQREAVTPAGRPAPSQAPERSARTDTFETGRTRDAEAPATYARPRIRGGTRPEPQPEAAMPSDSRAKKLAAIRKRIEAGAYDTRGTVERVVDRLLDLWNLSRPPAKDTDGR